MTIQAGGEGCDSESNPLIPAIGQVQERVQIIKDDARRFYYQVILSQHRCPQCGGGLDMVGESFAHCNDCSHEFDPTSQFQHSNCCQARLIRKPQHYACSKCGKFVPSKFLFDERLFHANYFREAMAAHRERRQRQREKRIMQMAENRSDAFLPTEAPDLDQLPGLGRDLDELIGLYSDVPEDFHWNTREEFSLQGCRQHILEQLGWAKRLFSSFEPVHHDERQDRAWRFITLIFMEHEQEVTLTQAAQADIWIEKQSQDEAYD